MDDLIFSQPKILKLFSFRTAAMKAGNLQRVAVRSA
jgi:hypothetical protein